MIPLTTGTTRAESDMDGFSHTCSPTLNANETGDYITIIIDLQHRMSTKTFPVVKKAVTEEKSEDIRSA